MDRQDLTGERVAVRGERFDHQGIHPFAANMVERQTMPDLPLPL